jgi:heme/copper-type cytochrome/quinol oxidase subunit 3
VIAVRSSPTTTTVPAPRTPPTEPTLTGVWVGIATITMSFAAFTAALVARQGAAADWQHFRLPPILYLNTLVLLMSSGTFELSRRRILAVPAPAWDALIQSARPVGEIPPDVFTPAKR